MKRHKLLSIVVLFCIVFTTLNSCMCNLPLKDRAKNKKLAFDATIPQPVGFVNDFEDVFSKSEEIKLDSVIKTCNDKADVQIVLATFDSVMIGKEEMKDYTFKVAQQWGVGESVKNNGLLIGICKERRIMYIQNGIGTATFLSDAATKAIIDTAFASGFKKENLFEGTLRGLHALTITIAGNKR